MFTDFADRAIAGAAGGDAVSGGEGGGHGVGNGDADAGPAEGGGVDAIQPS